MPLHSYPTLNIDLQRGEVAKGPCKPLSAVLSQAQAWAYFQKSLFSVKGTFQSY